jgi:DNA repair protein RadC
VRQLDLPIPSDVVPPAFRLRLSLVREEQVPWGDDLLLSRPSTLVRFFWERVFHDLDREVMLAAYLDVRHRLIGYTVVSVGTLNRAVVEPRGVLVPGLLANAASVVVAHNHPSGDPSPSAEDLVLTKRLSDAGEIVGLRLVDHIVVGEQARWVSLRERGQLG